MSAPLPQPPRLPTGYRVVQLARVDSTNAEATRRAASGETGGLWVVAGEQTGGRGRSGRSWASPPGNLYASLLIASHEPIARLQQLALLAPVAVHDAVASLAPGGSLPGLRLKWPNDVLAPAGKLSGILIESVSAAPGEPTCIVIGIGLNLVSHPEGLDQPAASLARLGIRATPQAAFEALAGQMAQWLGIWQREGGFEAIRRAWMERAGPLGEPLSVRSGEGRIAGAYDGLDETGALRLVDAEGRRYLFSTGQVALGHPEGY